MWCPNCDSEITKVIGTDKSYFVERFRKCESCGFSFHTAETVINNNKWQSQAEYSQDEIKRILKKRKNGTGQLEILK